MTVEDRHSGSPAVSATDRHGGGADGGNYFDAYHFVSWFWRGGHWLRPHVGSTMVGRHSGSAASTITDRV